MCCSRVDKRQAEGAIAARIHGLAHQPARHLADEFLPGRDDAGVRTAIARRNGERLQLAGHDVGVRRRLEHAQRHRFGKHHDQQRAVPVRDLGRRASPAPPRRRSSAIARSPPRSDRRRCAPDPPDPPARSPRRSRIPRPACPDSGRTCAAHRDTPDAAISPLQLPAGPGDARSHHGRLRHGRRAVVHGGIRHIHAGQLAIIV